MEQPDRAANQYNSVHFARQYGLPIQMCFMAAEAMKIDRTLGQDRLGVKHYPTLHKFNLYYSPFPAVSAVQM